MERRVNLCNFERSFADFFPRLRSNFYAIDQNYAETGSYRKFSQMSFPRIL